MPFFLQIRSCRLLLLKVNLFFNIHSITFILLKNILDGNTRTLLLLPLMKTQVLQPYCTLTIGNNIKENELLIENELLKEKKLTNLQHKKKLLYVSKRETTKVVYCIIGTKYQQNSCY